MAFGEAFDLNSEFGLFVKLGQRLLAIQRRERNPKHWWFRTYRQADDRVIRIGNVRIVYVRFNAINESAVN